MVRARPSSTSGDNFLGILDATGSRDCSAGGACVVAGRAGLGYTAHSRTLASRSLHCLLSKIHHHRYGILCHNRPPVFGSFSQT
jgi:hypothetical protein